MTKTRNVCLCMLLLGAASAHAADAEYAIRWAAARGGPATAAATAALLGVPATALEAETMTIRYFDIARPADAPGEFKVSLRERIRPKGAEITLKYRGTTALPAPPAGSWQCPLPGKNAERKDEVDISLLKTTVQTAYSRSCTVKGTVASLDAEKFKPVNKGCAATLHRLKNKQISVEEWKLDSGEVMIEVSANASDHQDDLARFRNGIAAKLLAAGANPLPQGMSELGTACRKS